MQLSDLKDLNLDSVLATLGLQRRQTGGWVGPAIGGLVLGAVAGIMGAFLLAPRTGTQLREMLRTKIGSDDGDRPEALATRPSPEQEERARSNGDW